MAGTGPHGRIVKGDVQTFVKAHLAAPRALPAGALPTIPAIDFSKFGPTETVPLSRIRARGAENLHRSWLNVVHVTQHDDADITDLEAFRAELKADAQAKEVKLTPLAFIVKAVIATLQNFPNFNASLDPAIRTSSSNVISYRLCGGYARRTTGACSAMLIGLACSICKADRSTRQSANGQTRDQRTTRRHVHVSSLVVLVGSDSPPSSMRRRRISVCRVFR
jgi:hypothetical protein